MSRLFAVAAAVTLVTFSFGPTLAADDTKVKSATRQVEEGAKTIGDGKVGTGVEETAKGIGNTVVEGSKYAGQKVKESGKAAEPDAKTAWDHLKEGVGAFGSSVKTFVTGLFSK